MNETIKIADQLVKVDSEDHTWLSLFKWSLNFKGYPQARIKNNLFQQVGLPWAGTWTMHSAILAKHKLLLIGSGLDVDHINRDRLDNQKTNLRQITRSANLLNSKRHDNRIKPHIRYET